MKTDTVCLTCKYLDFLNREMAKIGYGHCAHFPNGSFNSITHAQCGKFVSAPADIVVQRIEWGKKSKSIK